MSEDTLASMAATLMHWKAAKETAQEAEKEANLKIAEMEDAITKAMTEQEIEKFAHAGTLFYPYVESHPSIDKDKEPEFFDWLKDHNEDGIIKYTVHPQTLKAWHRQKGEQYAEELSEKGYLKVFERIRVGTRKQS